MSRFLEVSVAGLNSKLGQGIKKIGVVGLLSGRIEDVYEVTTETFSMYYNMLKKGDRFFISEYGDVYFPSVIKVYDNPEEEIKNFLPWVPENYGLSYIGRPALIKDYFEYLDVYSNEDNPCFFGVSNSKKHLGLIFGIEKTITNNYSVEWMFVETNGCYLTSYIKESVLKNGHEWFETMDSAMEWIFHGKMRWII